MLDEMLVNVTPYECRVALLLNEEAQELYLERANARSLVGNIYKGKVIRVLPGMQAAFVEIGLERAGFLHVGNIAPLDETGDTPMPATGLDIRDYCYLGQEILVQVSRDPLGTKGARLSAHISLLSRYLVYMPSLTRDFLSKRITDFRTREQLLNILTEVKGSIHCVIRTQAAGKLKEITPEALKAHMVYLEGVWAHIQEKAKTAKVGECCYEELFLPIRVWRDKISLPAHVQIDDKAMYHQMHDYVKKCFPEFVETINYYDSPKPIFDLYGVEQDITHALKPTCSLPSGGYLWIEQTEAMTTIDVNTGGFVGKENAEETFLKNNLEAVKVIARQLRLRNLGGIIVLDLIDMADEGHRILVRQALLKAMSGDFAKVTVNEFSGLGLIEMTRQRTRESLEHILCEPCIHCHGSGTTKRIEVVCMDIVREIKRKFNPFEEYSCTVIAAPAVVEHLVSAKAILKEALKNVLSEDVTFQSEPGYAVERFDVLMT